MSARIDRLLPRTLPQRIVQSDSSTSTMVAALVAVAVIVALGFVLYNNTPGTMLQGADAHTQSTVSSAGGNGAVL